MVKRIVAMVLIGLLVVVFCGCGKDERKAAENKQVELPKIITGKDGAKMVLIPAGEFQMGTDPAEIPELVQRAKATNAKASWFEHETPRHAVYLDAFCAINQPLIQICACRCENQEVPTLELVIQIHASYANQFVDFTGICA